MWLSIIAIVFQAIDIIMEAQLTETVPFEETQRISRCKNKPELLSLNEIYQENVGSECGYCHKQDTSFSWAFTKKKMESYTYQLLMERGWRRCGTYYYKPNLLKSCCKLYTHRLEVTRFKPKRDQKKALKRVIAFAYQKVEEMEPEKKTKQHENEMKNKNGKNKQKCHPSEVKEQVKAELQKICSRVLEFLKTSIVALVKGAPINETIIAQMSFDVESKLKFFTSKPEDKADYYSNLVMLIYGMNKKIFSHTKYSLIQFSKDVKEGIESLNPILSYTIQVERGGYLLFQKVREHSNEFEILGQKEVKMHEQKMEIEQPRNQPNQSGLSKIITSIKNTFKGQIHQNQQLVMKQQDKHHFQILKPEHKYKGQINIEYNKITFGKITVDIVPAEENVESFKLYQVYTKQIHEKKQKSLSSYVNFLCLQGLEFREERSKIDNQKKEVYIPSYDPSSKHQKPKNVTGEVKKLLGCYHMKYNYEGKVIGIGVVDIVDDGLSSVYFFYDPAFKEYRLGVFSSIIEIEYVRWMRLSFPEFRYYYMGFFISNSEKMNYKVDYMPCQLLCPITYHFVDFTEEIKAKVQRIDKGEEKDIRLAGKQLQLLDDMHFSRDIGPFIDKYLKLMYNGRLLVLKEINPHFFVHILKILKINVPVWGKKIFDILTFTV